MPVIFVGHGSPMNAIEDNIFSNYWKQIPSLFEKPKVILCISAHWYKHDLKVNNEKAPELIYDMYGFPQELYEVKYPAAGSYEVANKIVDIFNDRVKIDNSWGIDHGTWSVLVHMYPDADIPVLQLSIDASASPNEWFKIGQAIKQLRSEGVLIIGSGNIVHNLRLINWHMGIEGYDWAYDFDNNIKDCILNRDFDNVINYKKNKYYSTNVFEHPDHYAPLVHVLGCVDPDDKISVFNDMCVMGSISMTGYIFK